MENIFENMTQTQCDQYLDEVNRRSDLQLELLKQLNEAMKQTANCAPGTPHDDCFQKKQQEIYQKLQTIPVFDHTIDVS